MSKPKTTLETEDELEARKTWHHHRFVENAKKISTVRSKSEERKDKAPEQVTVKGAVINDEKLTREGRNRSRNGSHFRRRCRSNDVMLKNGKQCGSMSSLEMEIINDKGKVCALFSGSYIFIVTPVLIQYNIFAENCEKEIRKSCFRLSLG